MFDVTGPARVFEGMEECLDALREHKINAGDMIVLRYEGPKGGPGLPDVFKVMGYLVALNLHEQCAVITDGKVSGFAKGPFVCQVTPEAAVGGNIALVEDPSGSQQQKAGTSRIGRRARSTPEGLETAFLPRKERHADALCKAGAACNTGRRHQSQD